MPNTRPAVAAIIFAATVAPVVVTAQAPATERLLRVTSAGDDGSPGTLRWAVESSNGTPDADIISIEITGAAPHAITLKSPLPPIKGPVRIEAPAWKRTGEFVGVDGSGYIAPGGAESCPGATPGQFGANVRTMTSPGLQLIDTRDVEISGLEIRNFCIGILINRSTGVVIRDNRIARNRG